MKLKIASDTAKTELSQISDTNLMRRFQTGDEDSFKELVRRHSRLVFSYVYRVLRGCDEAEYIARDVFVRVYRQSDCCKPSVKFRKWLLALCCEHCRMLHQRSKQPFGRMSRQAGADRLLRKLPAPGYVSGLHAVSHDKLSMAVKKKVDSLPFKQRELIVLARYHKLSYREIEEITGVPADTVRQTLNTVKLEMTDAFRGMLE